VQEGDNGTVEWMDNEQMPYAQNYKKIIDEVVAVTGEDQ